MKRVAIEGGGWFDIEAAEKFKEGTGWNGNNRVSLATGDQWLHEELYRTIKGAWVKCRWSQWEGSRTTYERIVPQEAAAWLVRNEHEKIPAELMGFVAEEEV